jgi:hypothetical protein
VRRYARIGEAALGGDEDVLGDVLSGVDVSDDAMGDANDSLVMSPEERLEGRRGVPLALRFGAHRSRFHPHRLHSTAGAGNVTPELPHIFEPHLGGLILDRQSRDVRATPVEMFCFRAGHE